MNDFLYFSTSKLVEDTFEKQFGAQVTIKFDGEITHFLGISFNCKQHSGPERHVSIHMSQEAFIDTVLVKSKLDGPEAATCSTP